MNWEKPRAFAAKHRDEERRATAQSGGAFLALSDVILQDGGAVYGCVLDDTFTAIHARANTPEARDRMCRSKYVQSDMGDVFHRVRADLEAGRKVMFSGTSCQVDGLRAFLGREYDNLLCMDIICHGVPSPRVWRDFLRWQELRYHGRISAAIFRDKLKFGWKSHWETLTIDRGGDRRKTVSGTVYRKLFYKHIALRPSCYECPYKSLMHPGDITVGDYWGIDNAVPGFNDNKGTSLILVNNDRGLAWFERIRDKLETRETSTEVCMQTPLRRPFPCPKNRSQFWDDYDAKPFGSIARKYGGYGAVNTALNAARKCKRGLKRLLRR